MLSNKIVVFIGLISYPLYIWHWPLISFSWIIEGEKPLPVIRFGCFVVSIFMAWITFRFVEPKLRFGGHGTAKAVGLFLVMALLGALGMAVYKTNGLSYRTKDAFVEHIEKIINRDGRKCLEIFPDWTKINGWPCRMEDRGGENGIAIVGDSHGNRLFNGLLTLEGFDRSFASFGAACALPFFDLSLVINDDTPEKLKKQRINGPMLIKRGYEYIASHSSIKTVILSCTPDCSYYGIVDLLNPKLKDRNRILENGMRRTFDFLRSHGKNVIMLIDNPSLPFDPKKCIDRKFRFTQRGSMCRFDRKIHDTSKKHNWYKQVAYKVAKDYPEVRIINPTEKFCDDNFCYISKDGKLLYTDKNHLSVRGAMLVAPLIEELLQKNQL